MISIVSIPHTGTKFTEKLLLDMGFDVRHAHLHSTHPAQDARAWVAAGEKVVVPWRDPELARISARNRGEEPRPVSEFAELLAWADLPNVHLFDIAPGSDEAKESELGRLQVFLGEKEPPETDWKPVNESEDITGAKRTYMEKIRARFAGALSR
jgi:hypothetical protein